MVILSKVEAMVEMGILVRLEEQVAFSLGLHNTLMVRRGSMVVSNVVRSASRFGLANPGVPGPEHGIHRIGLLHLVDVHVSDRIDAFSSSHSAT